MSNKQTYIVKNTAGQVIGARQSARPYTHALIDTFTNEVVSYSSSEQGAQRAASKFYQYRDEAFRSQHVTTVVPVECAGVVKPVKLQGKGHDLTVKTFHAYKYAVINLSTGKLQHCGRPDQACFYDYDLAVKYAASESRTVYKVKGFDAQGVAVRDGVARQGVECVVVWLK